MSSNPLPLKEPEQIESNSHMPQFLVKAPWYINQNSESSNLTHQKKVGINDKKVPISNSTKRYLSKEPVYKYRKGACENCGAITHKTKECCERPRRRGAKFTNSNFKPDEFIEEISYDFEGKRDRWNGYEPKMEKRRFYEFEKYQELRKKKRLEKILNNLNESEKKKLLKDEDLEVDLSSDEENNIPDSFKEFIMKIANEDNNEFEDDVKKYFEEYKNKNLEDLPSKFSDIPKDILIKISKSKSLRIGEDISKYLLTLAENSEYYNKKNTYSLHKDNFYNLQNIKNNINNSINNTGDAGKLIELEKMIENANRKNPNLGLNNIAMPSQAELYCKYALNKQQNFKNNELQKVLNKYGGDNYFQMPISIKEVEDYDKNEFIKIQKEIKENDQSKKIEAEKNYLGIKIKRP